MKMLLLLAFIPMVSPAQSKKQRKALEAQQKADQQVLANINGHIQVLASGSDDAAKEYISKQFATIGLQPKGTNGYYQPFAVDDGKQIGSETFLKVNEEILTLNQDYFPLPYSASNKVSGMPAMALREKGVPWFADIKDLLEQSNTNKSSIEQEIQKEAAKVAAKGASALFIYNSSASADNISFDRQDKTAAMKVPVVYITSAGHKKYFSDHAAILDIELNAVVKEKNISGNNVAGYMDNGAASTVVIGANYGSLTDQNDTFPANAANIAGKNASSTAMLLELAKMLSASKAKNNNYLFIAFNHEDQELAGSRFWIEHAAVPASTNYMIALNPVAKNYPDNKLWINGIKTSASWQEIISAATIKNPDISLDTVSENPADITAFYQKEIPVLSFCKGTQEDATQQLDLKMAKMVYNVIEVANTKNKLTFLKSAVVEVAPQAAPENQPADAAHIENIAVQAKVSQPVKYAPKTMVSLGVIADNTASVEGLKINGVSPKKLAAKIGLQPGDILTYLGVYKIGDMKTYIQALSNFKPGDKTVLGIKRGKEDKEFAVEF